MTPTIWTNHQKQQLRNNLLRHIDLNPKKVEHRMKKNNLVSSYLKKYVNLFKLEILANYRFNTNFWKGFETINSTKNLLEKYIQIDRTKSLADQKKLKRLREGGKMFRDPHTKTLTTKNLRIYHGLRYLIYAIRHLMAAANRKNGRIPVLTPQAQAQLTTFQRRYDINMAKLKTKKREILNNLKSLRFQDYPNPTEKIQARSNLMKKLEKIKGKEAEIKIRKNEQRKRINSQQGMAQFMSKHTNQQ